MTLIRDLLYLCALPLVLLHLVWTRVRGHPARGDLAARLGGGPPLPPAVRRVLMHAVSVGEVNAVRGLVERLLQVDVDVVVSVTTDTGLSRAEALYGERCTVIRYPLDLGFAVGRVLDRVAPTVVVLVELEVWPNFMAAAVRRKIPVLVVNGRLSQRSFGRYKLVAPLLRSTFGRLARVSVQGNAYADRVAALGVPRDRITVDGTMKWDAAVVADDIAGADALAADLGIDRRRPLVVAGSTAPSEHALLLGALPEGAQLLCAPRRPEWFDQAATVLAGCNRRSSDQRRETNVFLLDTIGELAEAYALADVVVVGRSFAPLHGSDVAAPTAMGKATIVGPNVADFSDMVDALRDGGGLIQCTAEALPGELASLLGDTERAAALGAKGREIVEAHQGATARCAQLVIDALG